MSIRVGPLIFCLTMSALVPAALAQGVWRCGPDGRSYSDKPCPDGRAFQVADAPSETDVRSAQETAARERRLAESLRLERKRRDWEADLAGPAGIVMPARPVFKSLAPVTPPKKRRQMRLPLAASDTFQAVAAASRPTRD